MKKKIPTIITAAFAIEALLILFYAAVPWPKGGNLEYLFHLNEERNFPAYFSTLQLFVVAIAFGIFAWRNASWTNVRSLFLWALPFLFLGLSIDEFCGIHEMMGRTSDWFLPGGKRAGSAFENTGIWMFLLGLPFMVGSFFVFWIVRSYLAVTPGVLSKFFVGFLIFMGGALGVECLSNFIAKDSSLHLWQIIFEEGMEMAGVTLILWAAIDNLMGHGFSLRLDPVDLSEGEANAERADPRLEAPAEPS